MGTTIPTIILYTGDKYPALQFTLSKRDGSGAFDLTGLTAKCVIRLQGSAAIHQSGSCVINSATAATGLCTYAISTAFTDPGKYVGQVVVYISSGSPQRSTKFHIDVEEGLVPA